MSEASDSHDAAEAEPGLTSPAASRATERTGKRRPRFTTSPLRASCRRMSSTVSTRVERVCYGICRALIPRAKIEVEPRKAGAHQSWPYTTDDTLEFRFRRY